MKREDLEINLKEKMLFEGLTSTSKTFLSLRIAKLYAMNNMKVIYIDPENGTDREKKRVFEDLTDEKLENITLVNTNNIEKMLECMYGLREEVRVGDSNQTVMKTKWLDYDIKIIDGLTTEIELYMIKLTQQFIAKGYYEIGGKEFTIKNKDTFILPYQFYAKLYSQIKEVLIVMMSHDYDIICTTHPFKDTDSQKVLAQSLYQKFDTVIKTQKIIMSNGLPVWSGKMIKNRGNESPSKSNIINSLTSVLIYFIDKFNMDKNVTLERMVIEI